MIVILHNIRSLYNVGSIFRTSDAAGVEKIYLCGITPAPIDKFGRKQKQLAKVALGAENNIPWEKAKSTAQIIKNLKKEGYKILAIEQGKKSVSYQKFATTCSSKQKLALLIGNEVNGLPKSVLDKADKILEIPMRGLFIKQRSHPKHTGKGKESLNVSVAFGIVIFSLIKK